MTQEDLARRLLTTFIGELEDQVRAMNSDLLSLEKDPIQPERLRSLFRAAHTIKGAARVAGVPVVEDACHALEALLSDVRAETTTLSGSDFARMFAVVDGLTEAAVSLRAGEPVVEKSLRQVIDLLSRRSMSMPMAAPQPIAREDTLQADESAVAMAAEHAAEDGASSAAGDSADSTVGESVRIPAERLDELLNAVTELSQVGARLSALIDPSDTAVRRVARDLARTVDGVATLTHRLRLRAFRDAVENLPRAVRDVAAATGREIDLTIEGDELEVDRLVTDALREPILHLVRNAVDHGIETAAVRAEAGKPAVGTVRVSAQMARGSLRIVVEDDGGGVDESAVRAALAAAGRAAPATARGIARELLGGGLSSRTDATAISGRGVGLDLVRTAVEGLGGRVDMSWKRGRGTRFILEMPPRPAALRVLAVKSGGVQLAIPTNALDRLRMVRTQDVTIVEGRAVVRTTAAGGSAPLASLATLLGPPLQARTLEDRLPAMVLRHESDTAVIMVDEFGVETDIVLRPIPVGRARVDSTMGAALLPDGTVAIVLDPAALVSAAYEIRSAPTIHTAGENAVRRIMVVDDSITTRTLEQGVLETAGYYVVVAVDGEDAWRKLQQEDVDLIVADVEMPNMDGFGLLERLRSSRRFLETPVILVTGRESDSDRRRGLELGADAYLGKSSFDQVVLLDTVKQFIGDA
ncbi:MAG: response regulator [Longimicrobiales bacterium]